MDEAYQQVLETLRAWGETGLELIPNLIVALSLIITFWFLAKLAEKVSARAMGRMQTYRAARRMIAKFIRLSVLMLGLALALGIMNLDKALASILAGAGIVGLALGFAFQDLAANILSGIGLSFNRPFRIGELIETSDHFGTVEKVRLRTTEVYTPDGKMLLIPNKQIFQNTLTNHSRSGERRVSLECGVSYDEDLEKVKSLVLESLRSLSVCKQNKNPQVFFKEFGDGSINFEARFWIDYSSQADYWGATSDAIIAIKKCFDQNNITIPFPIRTLDFGIKGGDPLRKVLSDVSRERSSAA